MPQRYRVTWYNRLSSSCLDAFSRDRFDVARDLPKPHAILVRSHRLDSIPDSVLAIGRAGVAVNNIPVEAATRRGIPVFHTPGANAVSVAELTLGAILGYCRNIAPAHEFMCNLLHEASTISETADGDPAVSTRLADQIEHGKKTFVGMELHGRTIGIIGLGPIGVKVANRAHAFGMHVVWYDVSLSAERALELMVPTKQMCSIDAVLQCADIISLHVPLTERTRNLINASRIAQMRPGAILVNFSRKAIVDERAVLDALDEGVLGGYITDFGCINHPRILNLPHLGASTREAEERCGTLIAEYVIDYLLYGNITHSVNFPTTVLPRKETSTARICIVNKNVPEVLSRVTAIIAEERLNIEDLLNQSRGGIAYTIIDVAGSVSAQVARKIRTLEHVMRVRILDAPV